MAPRKGILERLAEGPVIGDGGFVFALEKRGYVKAGAWTPEATVENPDAVLQLHLEFLRAGSDVMQTFTFYASDDKLENRGNDAAARYTGAAINQAACDLARQAADQGNALVAGGICQTPTYLSGCSREEVAQVFRKQLEIFNRNGTDFIVCEYFEHIEEMEIAIAMALETQQPVAANMCIGPEGDMSGVTAGECAVRMARAGAQIVGVNCHFDPFTSLKTIKLMKEALHAEGLSPFLMCQPLAYHTPDCSKQGFIDLPEFPFALEPRVCSRFDMHRYAREAYNLGVRYIGGCCGFEPYHIRALSEELAAERGRLPSASDKHIAWGGALTMHTKPWVRARASREYWENLQPASGRPFSASHSVCSCWDVKVGDKMLKQHKEVTTAEEQEQVLNYKKSSKNVAMEVVGH